MGISPRTILGTLVLLISFGLWMASAQAQLNPEPHSEATADAAPMRDRTAHTVNVILAADRDRTFGVLEQRALQVAQEVIEQTFAENSHLAEVVVRILGERHGQTAPIVMVRVLRSDWQAQPSIHHWARSLGGSARVLLGFNGSPTQQTLRTASSASSFSRASGRGRGAGRRRGLLSPGMAR